MATTALVFGFRNVALQGKKIIIKGIFSQILPSRFPLDFLVDWPESGLMPKPGPHVQRRERKDKLLPK